MLRMPIPDAAPLNIDAKFFWTRPFGDLHEPFITQDFASFEKFLEAHSPVEQSEGKQSHKEALEVKSVSSEATT